MQVLLLEPDYWRYLGIVRILEADASIVLLGERDCDKMLGMQSAPPHCNPDVIILSHSLTIHYQLAIVAHLQSLFTAAKILVVGYDETLDTIARVLRAGAKGYFLLTSETSKLSLALRVVKEGHIWAPRDADALMAAQVESDTRGHVARTAAEWISSQDVAILKLLQKGLGNKQMAHDLDVAEVTIKTHLSKLYRKFGVRTRLELLAYAITHHLIPRTHTPRVARRAQRNV